MTWGEPFRGAWEHAPSHGRAAAREAALSPEKAAGVLSDTIAHSLQLVLFAAQDVHRIRSAPTDTSAAENAVPGMSALRRVMEDLRHGRIPPDKSEKHLQQAARAVAQQAKTPPGTVAGQRPDATEGIQPTLQRFNDQRRRFMEQLIAVHEARMKESSAMAGDTNGKQAGIRHNVAFGSRLAEAFAAIDQLFLDNKQVDDPAVPLPPPVS